MYKLWETLEEAKKLKWVELSHSLNNDSPYWSGIPEGSVELGSTPSNSPDSSERTLISRDILLRMEIFRKPMTSSRACSPCA